MRNEARARYNHATQTLRRVTNLGLAGTQQEQEQAKMEAATTQAMLEGAEANLVAARAGPTAEEIAVQQALIAQAEAEVERQKRELEKATIRAPFDGVVTAFHPEVGDRVSPTAGAIVDLLDVRYLIAEVNAPETYIGSLHVHDQAQVFVKGSAQAIPGLVIAVNELVEPESRTFRVRIAIDNEKRQFKAGQFAKVRLTTASQNQKCLTVPTKAIAFVEGQPHVYLLEKNKVRRLKVETGLTNDTTTEILQGIRERDQVVTEDTTLLDNGMSVTVKK